MIYMTVLEVVIYFILGLCTVTDCLYRKIWLPALLLAVPVILFCIVGAEKRIVSHVACGILFGAVFIGMSTLSRRQIEKGDGVLVGVMGLALGIWKGMAFLYLSFFYAFLAAVFLVVVQKKKKTYRMPFAPFALVGYLTMQLVGRML